MKIRRIIQAISLAFACSSTVYAANTVNLKIIAINDFHGQLESAGNFRNLPTDATSTVPVGGIDWIAGYVADIRNKNPNTVFVSAGDLIGASPLISALFHDEGTIETMNRAGLEINAVGNHEFEEGKDELLRMQNGGCHPSDVNSCQGATVGTPVPFEGANFKFLAANVIDKKTNTTLFAPYTIKEYEGIKVAFIGMTLKDTPSVVTPTGVKGLRFADEVRTANALVPKLRALGVQTIVVLMHQGGVTPEVQSLATMNNCVGNLDGSPIQAIVNGLSDEVDLVLSGHTHYAYNCKLPTRNGKHLIPVTSANTIGRIYTDIDMVLSKTTGDVRQVKATNVAFDQRNTAITPNASIKQIVTNYKTLVSPIANRVVGSITEPLTRAFSASGENNLGDVLADAQLAATQDPKLGGAQLAFMNPGGIRADLSYTSSSAGEGDGNVTYGEIFAVQPFGNSLVSLTLTGAQIETLLEQQFTGCTNAQPINRVLLPSEGFHYTWTASGTACDKVDPASISLNGITIDPTANYRVTVNSFLADGGDGFSVLKSAKNRLGGAQDNDALEAYFAAHSPISPIVFERVQVLP